MKLKKMNKNLFLGLIVILLIALPLIINKNAAFTGSDSNAKSVIEKINPDFKPWTVNHFFKPQSSEVETLLFSLQAALGTGIICYYLGYTRGKKKYADHR